MAIGYAINEVGGDGLIVNTVSDTRRAAIVNWLVTRANTPVTADRDDEWIEFMWKHLRKNTYCIMVDISAIQRADANVTERRSDAHSS